jgi:hypothetical protein
MKLSISLFILFVMWSAFGANETNALFVTDNGHIFLETAQARWIDPQIIKSAKTNCESWPAKDFPEGNWGKLTNGIQVSLRFDKLTYRYQEPIQVIVLVRNYTNRAVVLNGYNEVSLGRAEYLVFDASNKLIASKPKYTGLRSPSAGFADTIYAGLQRRYVDCLNGTYDLTNGNYLVQASISGYSVNGNVEPPVQIILTNGSYQARVTHPSTTETNTMSFFEIKSAEVPIEVKL